MPKISVIIPTYNRAGLLKDAIVSVLNQTYKDFELIVVDDNSDDETGSIVRKFQDRRIVYLAHNKNRGVSAAKNTGIKAARGEYVISLDDDDLMVAWAVEKFFEKFKQSNFENFGGVYGWSWWVNNKGNTLRITNSKERGYIFEEILKKQVFTNVLIKKEVFSEVGLYNEDFSSNEDLDFYLRMGERYQFDFIPEILTVIRTQPASHLSVFRKKHIRDHAKIIKKHSNNWRSQRFLMVSFFPARIYVSLSVFKNFIINKIKLFFNPKLKEEIKLIRKTFQEKGIKI